MLVLRLSSWCLLLSAEYDCLDNRIIDALTVGFGLSAISYSSVQEKRKEKKGRPGLDNLMAKPMIDGTTLLVFFDGGVRLR